MNVTGSWGDAIKKYGRLIDILLVLLILIFSFSVRYVNIAAPGITWDEPFYVHAGITDISNILHVNFTSSAWSENSEQPPVSKYLYGTVIWIFNGGRYDYNAFIVSKLLSAVMGAATCALVYLLCREFFDRRLAIASACILALIPDFLANTQMAALDAPIVLFFTLTIYLFMLAVKNDSLRFYLASAISLSLLVDTKFNGLLAIPIMAIFFIVNMYKNPSSGKNLRKLFPMKLPNALRKVDRYLPVAPTICFIMISIVVAVIIWPWIWLDPLNLGRTLKHWIDVTPYEYFLGTYQKAPLYYYPVYFIVTTPVLLLIPLVVGIYTAIRSKSINKYAIVLWFFIPFLYDFSNFVQDCMRYLLMIYPAVAILCAIGLDEISRSSLIHNVKIKNILFISLTICTVAYLIFSLLSISPYYLDYYNSLAGGTSNANDHRLFEVGWWGEGIYDSVMHVENTASPNSTVYVAEPNHMIGIYAKNDTYILQESDEESVPDNVDYIITNLYSDKYLKVHFNASRYQVVYETKAQGAALATVYKKVTN